MGGSHSPRVLFRQVNSLFSKGSTVDNLASCLVCIIFVSILDVCICFMCLPYTYDRTRVLEYQCVLMSVFRPYIYIFSAIQVPCYSRYSLNEGTRQVFVLKAESIRKA